jgi:hypothetical protein
VLFVKADFCSFTPWFFILGKTTHLAEIAHRLCDVEKLIQNSTHHPLVVKNPCFSILFLED